MTRERISQGKNIAGNKKMIEFLSGISTALAVTGVMLNNRLKISCFYVWLISNSICAGIHINAGLLTLAAKDVIFIVMAFEGILLWRRKLLNAESAESTEKNRNRKWR